MFNVSIVWAFLVLASTTSGLILARVGSRSARLVMAAGGVLACIGVSSVATVLLLANDAVGMN